MSSDLEQNGIKRSFTERPVFKVLGLVTPLIAIIITAALYLAGFTYDNLYLDHFGNLSGVLDRPTPATIVDGYLGLIEGLPIFLAQLITVRLAIWTVFIIILGGVIGIVLVKTGKGHIVAKQKWVPRFYMTILYLSLAFFAFHIATVCADIVANRRIALIETMVTAGCRQCLTYRTSSGDFIGYSIGNDKTRLIIVQIGGVRILKLDELRGVLPPTSVSKH